LKILCQNLYPASEWFGVWQEKKKKGCEGGRGKERGEGIVMTQCPTSVMTTLGPRGEIVRGGKRKGKEKKKKGEGR